MRRVQLTDNLHTAMFKLAENNPGAIRAIADVIAAAPDVDPDSALGGLGFLLDLDKRGIYGDRIWMLYSDACERDPIKVLALFRANQLGQLADVNDVAIERAISNYGEGLDWPVIIAAVQQRLPNFAKQAADEGIDYPIGETVFRGTCANCRSWPNRCQTCRGWGVTTFQQSVPYGSTSASFDVTDPCEACTANGNCARCGEPGLTSEDRGDDTTGDGPCKFCSWNYEDGLPEEPYDDGPDQDEYDKPEGPLSVAGRRAWEGTD